jgi:hypothetical protein
VTFLIDINVLIARDTASPPAETSGDNSAQ